ncbi:prepilin-type N-terminal cleavage/methylation domain-containing protein [Desulfitobacterium sp.]|uniref:prepilin-type N-terminal cleavage/methylation domain-containing protein n=1 Tax=Desulfitobacterium sp. TaxID=49981 RepID=UPI002CA89281|nr:prepilin-type N-terminal cleavage/methylation domain-containing protein [Desulfitobacterium sp.]HVJ48884.1 prepilin-type N-terminal cleavage/methylation domain-containing protein [Desulfitobacterium sp.]
MLSRSRSGYTLIELLLVLVLLSGAGFVLLVKLPVQQNERNLALASTQLVQEIRDTRQAALSERTWYEVKFFYAEGFYRITREGKPLKDIYLPKGVIMENAPADFRFYASGSPNIGGTINLKADKLKRNVIMMPVTARVREEIVN